MTDADAGKTNTKALLAPPVDDDGAPLPRLPHAPADAKPRDYAKTVAFSAAAKPLAKTAATSEELLDVLIDRGHYLDAIRLTARATHPWRCVEWALEALRQEAPPEPGSDDDERLALVEQFLDKPSDAARVELMDRARQDEYESPACWVMAAAGWSYGSIAPQHLGVVIPPPEGLCAKTSATAITLVAQAKPKLVGVTAPRLLALGLDYARMDPPEPWPPEDEPPPPEDPEERKRKVGSLAKPTGEAVVTKRVDTTPTRPAPPPIRPTGPARDDGDWAPKPL